MVLTQLGGGGGFDFVQDTTPTNPELGDTFLDTSQNPPVAKVFADLGSGGQFTQIASNDLIQQNLDAPVSNAGATQSEITSGVNAADTGINWAAKTPKIDEVAAGGTLSVSGAGYLIGIFPTDYQSGYDGRVGPLKLDGTELVGSANTLELGDGSAQGGSALNFFHRFDNSLEVSENSFSADIQVSYVLD